MIYHEYWPPSFEYISWRSDYSEDMFPTVELLFLAGLRALSVGGYLVRSPKTEKEISSTAIVLRSLLEV